MIKFKTIIQKFAEQGEKTGWTYIKVSEKFALQLKPNNKKSFRVKGKLDDYAFKSLAMIPFGGGDFIIALNANIRKEIKKQKGDELIVELEEDKKGYVLNKEFIECLNDEPKAMEYFKTLAPSHQNYYSKWIESAKTIETKTKRIAQAVNALSKKWHYGMMIRNQTEENKKLKEL